jgi:hypothetical protein
MGTLNEFLQPTDSPIALNQGAISSYSFDSQNERNSISAAKIQSVNLSVASGGTLTVGGTTNQLGELEVYNATQQLLAEVNNMGITLHGTTALQYYDDTNGAYIASFGPQSGGTAYLQTASGIPFIFNMLGPTTFQMGASSTGTVVVNGKLQAGTLQNTNLANGTYNNGTLGTPAITGGTMTNPVIGGTATYAVNANTAALAADNLFALQTKSGSVVLVVRSGGTNFFFNSAGTF